MDGRRIKALAPDLPVIAYTGFTLTPSASPPRLADACLTKGSDLAPLKRTVSNLLSQKAPERGRSFRDGLREADAAVCILRRIQGQRF